MKTFVFKKIDTLGYRLEILFWKWWEKPFIRFLFVGAINTGLGYLTTLALRYTWFKDEPKWLVLPWSEQPILDVSNTIMFIMLFPVSYTLQTLLSFRTKWQVKRLLIYPLSSIPNYLLQQGFIFIFETWFGLPFEIAYAFSAILPIPIMYVIIRFFVVAKPKPSL
jgi:putative flippase GtrA